MPDAAPVIRATLPSNSFAQFINCSESIGTNSLLRHPEKDVYHATLARPHAYCNLNQFMMPNRKDVTKRAVRALRRQFSVPKPLSFVLYF
jgi:hypothetical protein